ncbi:MAG: hypothetical protein LUD03_04810 [Firmicutes bacterium]|nr:hypothetical protein [Bacillota bacterium]
MKKFLLAAASLICVIMLASCGGAMFAEPSPTPVPEIDPSEILTLDDVAAYVDYELVSDGVMRDGNTASVLYRTEPIGMADTVEIKITQYNESVSADDVWNEYAVGKAARTTAEDIAELGESAYIAFPSINIYDRGCYIKITAGSGSDEGQRNMLLNLAYAAVPKFEAVWQPLNVTE